MTHFLQKISENSRPWLRVYKPNTELKRIDELKLKNQELIDKTDMLSLNKEWPYDIKNYMKQYDK